MSRGQKLVMMYQLDESKDKIKEIAKKYQITTKTISREMRWDISSDVKDSVQPKRKQKI